MPDQMQSLRSKQRSNIFHAYRGRGHKDNNLWLVHSIKTDRDYILPSDRQLIHWIHYLETDRNVKMFDLMPQAIMSVDSEEVGGTELDATVMYLNGDIEWHEVKSAESETSPGKSQLQALTSATNAAGVIHRVFTDQDLKPHVVTSIRWLKAIAYASVIQTQECVAETIALQGVLQSQRVGVVRQILETLPEFEAVILQGLLVRLAIRGHVDIDLSAIGFRLATTWRWLRN